MLEKNLENAIPSSDCGAIEYERHEVTNENDWQNLPQNDVKHLHHSLPCRIRKASCIARRTFTNY